MSWSRARRPLSSLSSRDTRAVGIVFLACPACPALLACPSLAARCHMAPHHHIGFLRSLACPLCFTIKKTRFSSNRNHPILETESMPFSTPFSTCQRQGTSRKQTPHPLNVPAHAGAVVSPAVECTVPCWARHTMEYIAKATNNMVLGAKVENSLCFHLPLEDADIKSVRATTVSVEVRYCRGGP